MRYLSSTVPVYRCVGCDRTLSQPEVVWDGYGEGTCPCCEHSVESSGEREATFWSVGVYEVCRCYGGPEEGGWWYDAGTLIERRRVRVFEDLDEAERYHSQLWDEVPEDERRGEIRTYVCGWTESLPESHWPKAQPRYC